MRTPYIEYPKSQFAPNDVIVEKTRGLLQDRYTVVNAGGLKAGHYLLQASADNRYVSKPFEEVDGHFKKIGSKKEVAA